MSLPPVLNITLMRNGSWSRTLTLADDDGAPLDITGVTFDMDVRYSAGAPGAALGAGTVSVTDGPAGEATVELVGSAFAAVPGAQDIVRLAYDIRMLQGSTPTVILAGELALYPGVSDGVA